MNISFGTEGWRAVIGDKFTFDNVRKFAHAVANWLYWPKRGNLDIYANGFVRGAKLKCASPNKGVAIGYDTRFMSDKFASVAADEFAACGIPVFLSSSFTVAPIISDYVLNNNLAAGIIITASHNTPEYNGIKYKGEYGGSAVPEIIWGIEKMFETKIDYIPSDCRRCTVSLFYLRSSMWKIS